MARRSRRELRALYAFRRSRPTSRADGPGYLYAYVDRGHLWKIGMSNDFTRRKGDWDRQCPSIDRIWMPPVAVTRRRRAGEFAHVHLDILVHLSRLRVVGTSPFGDPVLQQTSYPMSSMCAPSL
ncbi:hypothetical protein F5878DRAFT_667746 [Lentinula raphanica]|uniref:Uncharacterized protein n=1 Tax=Lentinula raphanica TaxID=153919 RepID=A0AA38NV81_9AGAR|nr:hypothetical protein F5878DRAFT_667746 [Lentinula raphanica]